MKKQFHLIILMMEFTIVPVMAQNPFGLGNDTTTTRDIYGYDSRREAPKSGYNNYTKAVLTMMDKASFEGDIIRYFSLENYLKRAFKVDKVDPTLKFKDQPAYGGCTGFLIAPDIMITAAHCISTDNHEIQNGRVVSHSPSQHKYGQFTYDQKFWVFDYTNDIPTVQRYSSTYGNFLESTIPSSNRYSVKKVIVSVMDWTNHIDYAVIQLDRPTTRDPFRFRTGAKVDNGTPLAMIGSPSGVPLKLADGAEVTINSGTHWFGTNLDAFGGNSGGPVYSTTGLGMIEGILVRGRIDKGLKGFYVDQNCNCVKEVRYSDADAESFWDLLEIPESGVSTEVQRITTVPLDIRIRAVYDNLAYSIHNNDKERFNKWLIYEWIINQDTMEIIRNTLIGDPSLAQLALDKGRDDMFKTLLDKGADYKRKDASGRDLLYYAIRSGRMDAVEQILAKGYNLSNKDGNGETPLFWAINTYNSSMVDKLLEKGASVDDRDNYGNTPLHAAVRQGSLSLVETLLSKGADPKASNYAGQTPRKLATSLKYKELKKRLKKAEKGK